ncbi:hypothetical protein IJD15_00410 [bacterium]|nr:hypothetical protein [bacterium]
MLIGKLLSSIITPVKRVRADGSKKMTLPIRRADVFEMSEELKNQKQAYGILSRNDKFSIDSFRSLSEEENLLLRNVADIDTKTAVNATVDLGVKFKSFLDDKYGENGYVFVSIGTSPSGIARVMEFSGVETKYLPVTDLTRVSSEEDIDKHDDKYPTYIQFLKQQGLSKEEIDNSGKKYLFYDYTFTGKSLAIFEVLMKNKFGIDSENIEYHSLNKDLMVAGNTIPNFHKNANYYIEEYLKDSSMAMYGGVPHLRLDEMDKVFTKKQSYGNAPNLFNFLMMHILDKSNLLKENPKNKNSI